MKFSLACSLILALSLVSCSASAGFTKLDLSSVFDAKAAASGPGDSSADFDGNGRSYPVELLPSTPTYIYNGIEFDLPPFHNVSAADTIRSNGQVLNVTGGRFQSFHALGAAIWNPSSNPAPAVSNVTLHFSDGSAEDMTIIISPWFSAGAVFPGPIYMYVGSTRRPYHYANPSLDSNLTIDTNNTHIQYTSARIRSDKNLTALTLPPQSANTNFFSITLLPAQVAISTNASTPALSVQVVRSTTKWFDNSTTAGPGAQIIEVTINNLSPLDANLSQWVTTNHTVHLESSSLTTVVPGSFRRLRSNDQVVVSVGVQNVDGIALGSNATVTVVIKDQNGTQVAAVNGDQDFPVTAGIPAYENTDASLATHEAPNWGIYSVPAWAPTGNQYAAWYNWDLHNPANADSPTWVRHREVYGENFLYDDFIANWTASLWNPDDWIDLFADAGAKYFVLVTKHHDGFSLFDTGNSSQRNSVLLGPKRDIVKELLDSAKKNHPELRRGLYYSLPEWFNPDYGIYGHQSFPGHPALYAYNGSCCEPYVGYTPVDNFLEDVQKPQMKSLFYTHDAEMLWCDIGYATAFPEIAGDWYNYAASQGRQVVRDDRCGDNQTDFSTPEYATYSAVLSSKWETSEGMDPFSYAYNSDTPPDAYKNASIIIPKLVDIVSKGGNYLLGVGPREDGTIISPMTDPLREVGQWLKSAGEAVFGTRIWWMAAADETPGFSNVRFTTKPDAFYVTALARPNGSVSTPAPVPIASRDTVTLLGGSGVALNWTSSAGNVTIQVPDSEVDMVKYAWVFKVTYA
ncbi:glycoside hydrolase family 29 protein [Dentipellis sp. KUC8613]|nr:glycoside hydrolase family 29 protein [Dentipellis sp. KUC8613]